MQSEMSDRDPFNVKLFGGKPIEEIKIPVPYGHICGVWWGPKNQQPVLALHGWQDNVGTWETLVPLLSPEISVLAIDLPGHGYSSHYPPGQMYFIFYDGVCLVKRIARYFNWKKVTILGHSLGGAIGFLYAGLFPDEIEKLISIDIVSPTIREPSTDIAKTREYVEQFLKYETLKKDNVPCYNYEEMINLVVEAYNGSINKNSCKMLMKRGLTPSPKGSGYFLSRDIRLKSAGLGFVSIELALTLAENIKCNVLNIKGKPGMTFENSSYYYKILDKIRRNAHLEFHEIEGTHHLHLNTPEKICGIINKFLLQPVITNGACSSIEDDEDFPV